MDQLNEIIVVPVTRTIRGLTAKALLSSDDGMPVVCALNFDHVSLPRRTGPSPCKVFGAAAVAAVRIAE
jgi:mRNA interferase MazF